MSGDPPPIWLSTTSGASWLGAMGSHCVWSQTHPQADHKEQQGEGERHMISSLRLAATLLQRTPIRCGEREWLLPTRACPANDLHTYKQAHKLSIVCSTLEASRTQSQISDARPVPAPPATKTMRNIDSAGCHTLDNIPNRRSSLIGQRLPPPSLATCNGERICATGARSPPAWSPMRPLAAQQLPPTAS